MILLLSCGGPKLLHTLHSKTQTHPRPNLRYLQDLSLLCLQRQEARVHLSRRLHRLDPADPLVQPHLSRRLHRLHQSDPADPPDPADLSRRSHPEEYRTLLA
jgi:hypothetical protein